MIQQPISIAIIGAGISGLSLAVSLSKYPHITYTIYESRPSYAEIGAGIGFSTNGNKAMNLISPELWAKYQENATFNGSPEKRGIGFCYEVGEKKNEGKRIVETVLPDGLVQSTIHRQHLLKILIDTLPDKGATCTQFSKKLTSITSSGPKPTCHFSDGTQITSDLIIGCDGIKSACRTYVFGSDPSKQAQFTGKVAYRGLIPMERVIEKIGKEKALNRHMYFGHGGHMLTFGVAGGKMLNIVCFHGEERWESERVVQARTTQDFLRDFEGWGHAVTSIIGLIEKPDVWAIFDHPRVDTFHKGRVVLLGDAAHTTSPHFGMGGGMSVEDASILSTFLGHCTSVEDIPSMLKAYDGVRVKRCCDIVAASRHQGRLCDFEVESIGDDLDKIAYELDSSFRTWMWAYEPEEAVEEALKEFKPKKAETRKDWVSIST